jgi:hypothetical protein
MPVNRIVKGARSPIVLLTTLFAIASIIGTPATVHADDPNESDAASPDTQTADFNGGPHNIVKVVNRHDHELRVKGHVQLGRAPGSTVAPENLAAAVNVCQSQCDALAVALQINLVDRDFTVFTPQNVAVAANGGCNGCRAVAVALQYNIGVDSPDAVPSDVNRLIAQMKHELAQMGSGGDSLQDAIARLNIVIGQYNNLAGYLIESIDDHTTPARAQSAAPAENSAAPVAPSAPASDPAPAEASPALASPTTESSPPPEPEPSPTPAPAETPSSEATPQPNGSP